MSKVSYYRIPVETLESRIAPAGIHTLTVPEVNGLNGFSVKAPGAIDNFGSVGDINGDGIADLAFSTLANNGGRGIVYVVFGKSNGFPEQLDLATLNGTNGFTITGAAAGDNLGLSMTGIGDVNGNGVNDFIITAQGVDTAGINTGAAYILYGHSGSFAATMSVSSLNGTNGFTINGEFANENFGGDAESAGDLNGDGHQDFAIGASNASSGAGAVYIVFGKANSSFPAVLSVSAITGNVGFGLIGGPGEHIGPVNSAGDVNGDGVKDLSIGQDVTNYAIDQPKMYIIFGDSAISSEHFNGFQINSNAKNGIQLSNRVFSADINHDGNPDLLTAAIYTTSSGISAGVEFVIYGTSQGFTADPFINGFPEHGAGKLFFSQSKVFRGLFSLGDFNGDGSIDYLLSLNGETESTLYYGTKSLVGYELAGGKGDEGIRFVGTSDQGAFNASVRFSEDVNGDGIGDIMLRVPASGGSQMAYIVFGGSGKIASSGKSFTYKDWDGDLVTVSVSKGELDYAMFSFAAPLKGTSGAAAGGKQLVELNLADGGSQFEGANVKVSVHRMPGGDGLADVGTIDATGLNLGKVKIQGGLGTIEAGHLPASSKTKFAVGSISATNLGYLDTDAIWGAPDTLRASEIVGGLGLLKITHDFDKARLTVTGGSSGKIGKVTIGGDLIGGDELGAGAIEASATLGSITVLGSIEGNITPVIISAAGIAADTQAHSLAIKSLTVKKSASYTLLLAGYAPDLSPVNPDASIGTVTIGKNWLAGSISAGFDAKNSGYFGDGDDALIGAVDPFKNRSSIAAAIGSIVVKGRVNGTTGTGDKFGFIAEQIDSVKIGGKKLDLSLADPLGMPFGDTGDFVVRG